MIPLFTLTKWGLMRLKGKEEGHTCDGDHEGIDSCLNVMNSHANHYHTFRSYTKLYLSNEYASEEGRQGSDQRHHSSFLFARMSSSSLSSFRVIGTNPPPSFFFFFCPHTQTPPSLSLSSHKSLLSLSLPPLNYKGRLIPPNCASSPLSPSYSLYPPESPLLLLLPRPLSLSAPSFPSFLLLKVCEERERGRRRSRGNLFCAMGGRVEAQPVWVFGEKKKLSYSIFYHANLKIIWNERSGKFIMVSKSSWVQATIIPVWRPLFFCIEKRGKGRLTAAAAKMGRKGKRERGPGANVGRKEEDFAAGNIISFPRFFLFARPQKRERKRK